MAHIKLNFLDSGFFGVLLLSVSITTCQVTNAKAESFCEQAYQLLGPQGVGRFQRLEFTKENLQIFRSKVESAAREGKDFFKLWEQQIGINENSAYRGMILSSDELELILKEGMKASKADSSYAGIYAASTPFTPLTYALFGGGKIPDKKNLAVLFELDLTRLAHKIERGPYSFTLIEEDVPTRAIRRILIFDPHTEPSPFPFKELKVLEQ